MLPVVGLLYLRFGFAPVATASTPMPFERQLAHMALNAVVDKDAPKTVPIQSSEENYLAGAHVYRTNCAMCHGLPGQAAPPISKGEFPTPPQLFPGTGVTDDPAGETYWKVTNGIRLTGMPAYVSSLSEKERWQVSLLLSNADKLPAEAQTVLKQPFEVR